MKFIVCSVDILPCPPENQGLYSLADIVAESINLIEPSSLVSAYSFGAASVLTWWFLGFVISSALKVLKKA